MAGTLWPDYSTERSLADLRTTLWRVNQSSDQVIVATSSILRLDEDVEVDVRNLLAFARRLDRAETPSETVDLSSVGLAVTPTPSRPRSLRSTWSRCVRPLMALLSRHTWPRAIGRKPAVNTIDAETC